MGSWFLKRSQFRKKSSGFPFLNQTSSAELLHSTIIFKANILIGAWRARMLFWRFKMTQIWNRHTNNLFSRFLALGTCTGRPRTHRIANDSPSSTQYDVRAACELWSQVCRVPPHTALAIYSHDQYIWLHLVDRPDWSFFPQDIAWRVKNFVKTDFQVVVRRALAMATQWKNS